MNVNIEELWTILGRCESGSLYTAAIYTAFKASRHCFFVHEKESRLMYVVLPEGMPLDLGPKTYDQFEDVCRRNCTTIKPINELQQLS